MTPEEKAKLKAEITQELGMSLQEHYVSKAELKSLDEKLGELLTEPQTTKLLGETFEKIMKLQLDVHQLQVLIALGFYRHDNITSEKGRKRFDIEHNLRVRIKDQAKKWFEKESRNPAHTKEQRETAAKMLELL